VVDIKSSEVSVSEVKSGGCNISELAKFGGRSTIGRCRRVLSIQGTIDLSTSRLLP
jgi:hypothetical protein